MIKKVYLFIFLILFSIIGYTQNFNSCKETKKQASLDFKKGISLLSFHYIFDDLDESAFYKTEEKYQKFYENYLLKNYNINFNYSYTSFEFEDYEYKDCYKQAFEKLFFKKNGNSFLSKFKTEIDLAYQKFNTSKKDSLHYFLDFEKVYTYVDSSTKFKGNDKVLKEFLIKITNRNLNIKNSKQKEIIKFEFTIDTNGKATNCIVTYKNEAMTLKKIILKKINRFGTWIPAYLYNNKVKSIYSILPFEISNQYF